MSVQCMGCMTTVTANRIFCDDCQEQYEASWAGKNSLSMGSILENRYLLGRTLSVSKGNITYLAWDKILERKAVVKEFLPADKVIRKDGDSQLLRYVGVEEMAFLDDLKHFYQRGKRLSRLEQIQNLVSVYDCFYANGTAYVVMEYLEGETLSEVLKSNQNYFSQMGDVFIIELLTGLSWLHRKGFIHGRICPWHIYITTEGKVKIISVVTGNPHKIISRYAPIEQCQDSCELTPAMDVYGAAAVIYRMLCGRKPPESIKRLEKDTVKNPKSLGIKIHASFWEGLQSGFAVSATERCSTIQEFKGILESEIAVGRVAKEALTKRTRRRIRLGLGSVALVLFLLIGRFFWLTILSVQQEFSSNQNIEDSTIHVTGTTVEEGGQEDLTAETFMPQEEYLATSSNASFQ